MSDDDKTAKDEPAADAAADATEEPEAEAKEDDDEKPAEDASSAEPKTDEPADEAPATSAAQPAGTDQQGRQLYNVKCSNCGKDTQVPFQPSGDRPVYCRDCYMQKKNAQG